MVPLRESEPASDAIRVLAKELSMLPVTVLVPLVLRSAPV